MESICSRAGSSGPRRAGNDAADAPHPGAVCTAGAGPRRPGGGLAGAVLRRYRRAADSVETAADGKNDSRGAIGFGHRARIEQSADGDHGLRAVAVGARSETGAVFGSDQSVSAGGAGAAHRKKPVVLCAGKRAGAHAGGFERNRGAHTRVAQLRIARGEYFGGARAGTGFAGNNGRSLPAAAGGAEFADERGAGVVAGAGTGESENQDAGG